MTQYQGHPDQRFGHISYAQHFDDGMLLNLTQLLSLPRDLPAWLDLGAHHPVDISNTKLMYDAGFHGINIEVNPKLYAVLETERPRDLNLNLGIGPVAGKASFFMYGDTCGLNTFSSAEVEKLKDLAVQETVERSLHTINQIVTDSLGGWFPPFLLVDIEGLDFGVLSGADFSLSSPLVICVETRRNESTKMINMLERKGYAPYCRMGENLFFIRKTELSLVY